MLRTFGAELAKFRLLPGYMNVAREVIQLTLLLPFGPNMRVSHLSGLFMPQHDLEIHAC
ncbi:hypothetical protein [Acidicapsa acidisoli]|uniref:hypothetical protein n=1 Tax=Acidicapsa acidisoli TaxID=1615681 RepID=UPI0021E05C79|nr:hypothetical protein [Acidicapsa acidisoli]